MSSLIPSVELFGELQSWGLGKYCGAFKDEEIDLFTFMLFDSVQDFVDIGVAKEDIPTLMALASDFRQRAEPGGASASAGRNIVIGPDDRGASSATEGFMILCSGEVLAAALHRRVFDLGNDNLGAFTKQIGMKTLLFVFRRSSAAKDKGRSMPSRIFGPFTPESLPANNIHPPSSAVEAKLVTQIRFRDEHRYRAPNGVAVSKLRVRVPTTGALTHEHVTELLFRCENEASLVARPRLLPPSTSTSAISAPHDVRGASPASALSDPQEVRECVDQVRVVIEKSHKHFALLVSSADKATLDGIQAATKQNLAGAVLDQDFALAAVLKHRLFLCLEATSRQGAVESTALVAPKQEELKTQNCAVEAAYKKEELQVQRRAAVEKAALKQEELQAQMRAAVEKAALKQEKLQAQRRAKEGLKAQRRAAEAAYKEEELQAQRHAEEAALKQEWLKAQMRAVADEALKQEALKSQEELKKKALIKDKHRAKEERQNKLEAEEEARREKASRVRENQKEAQIEAERRKKAADDERLNQANERVAADKAKKDAYSKELHALPNVKPSFSNVKPSFSKTKATAAADPSHSATAHVTEVCDLSAALGHEVTEDPQDASTATLPTIKRFVAVDEGDKDLVPMEVKVRKAPVGGAPVALNKLMAKILFYETNEFATPIHGGRDWDLCKEDLGMMIGLSDDSGLTEERDIGGSEAATEVDLSNYSGGVDEALRASEKPLFSSREVAQAKGAISRDRTIVFESVELSKPVFKWLQSAKFVFKYRFIRSLEQIAEDPPVSLHILKPLLGQKHTLSDFPLRACPLGEDLSFVFQERPSDPVRGSQSAIIVFYVVKADRVDGARDLIQGSYQRMRSHTAGFGEGVPEVFLNPGGSSPIPFFELELARVHDLLEPGVYLPMRLTNEELSVVKNSRMVLGRSGTGKTNCIIEKMRRTFVEHIATGKLAPRQAFVARSRALCNQTKRMFTKGAAAAGVPHRAVFMTIDEIILRLEDAALRGAAAASSSSSSAATAAAAGTVSAATKLTSSKERWPSRKQIRFSEFEVAFQGGRLKPKRSAGVAPKDADGFDPLDVWKQIRSVIKGGPLVAWDNGGTRVPGTPLSFEEYLSLPASSCPLDQRSRKVMYAVFESYTSFTVAEELWDDTDRVIGVLALLQQPSAPPFGGVAPFDYVSLDEVQDATMAEISLLLLAAGADPSRLLLAGDTAQTIQVGSNFRFEDVRSVIFQCSPNSGKKSPMKVDILSKNYRSHSGILRLAALPLDGLTTLFPGSNSVLAADFGLAQGALPGITLAKDYKQLALLLARDRKLVVITRDDHVSFLLNMCDRNVSERIAELESAAASLDLEQRQELTELRAAEFTIMGVKEVKGLEFEDVALVDFLGQAPETAATAWARFFDIDFGANKKARQEQAVSLGFPGTFEAELKEMYVAFTRPRAKFFLVELHPKSAEVRNEKLISRFTRELVERELAGVSEILPRAMLPEEWLQRGLLFCIAATTDDSVVAQTNLNRAVRAFEKGGTVCADFLRRVKCLMQYWSDRSTVTKPPPVGAGASGCADFALSVACESATELFDAGLLRESQMILEMVELKDQNEGALRLVVELQARIQTLSAKYNENITSYYSSSNIIKSWKSRAEDGDVEAMLTLAPLCEEGASQLPKSHAAALALVERAKSLGSCEAFVLHATYFVEGRCGLRLDSLREVSERMSEVRLSAWSSRSLTLTLIDEARCSVADALFDRKLQLQHCIQNQLASFELTIEHSRLELKQASANLCNARHQVREVAFMCSRALRRGAWAQSRHDGFFKQGRPLEEGATKKHADRLLDELSRQLHECTLPSFVRVVSRFWVAASFEKWKRQGRTAILTRMSRKSSKPTLLKVFIRFKNVAAAHRIASMGKKKPFTKQQGHKRADVDLTTFWNSKSLQSRSRHPRAKVRVEGEDIAAFNRGAVSVILVPWTLTKESRQSIFVRSEKRLEKLTEKYDEKMFNLRYGHNEKVKGDNKKRIEREKEKEKEKEKNKNDEAARVNEERAKVAELREAEAKVAELREAEAKMASEEATAEAQLSTLEKDDQRLDAVEAAGEAAATAELEQADSAVAAEELEVAEAVAAESAVEAMVVGDETAEDPSDVRPSSESVAAKVLHDSSAEEVAALAAEEASASAEVSSASRELVGVAEEEKALQAKQTLVADKVKKDDQRLDAVEAAGEAAATAELEQADSAVAAEERGVAEAVAAESAVEAMVVGDEMAEDPSDVRPSSESVVAKVLHDSSAEEVAALAAEEASASAEVSSASRELVGVAEEEKALQAKQALVADKVKRDAAEREKSGVAEDPKAAAARKMREESDLAALRREQAAVEKKRVAAEVAKAKAGAKAAAAREKHEKKLREEASKNDKAVQKLEEKEREKREKLDAAQASKEEKEQTKAEKVEAARLKKEAKAAAAGEKKREREEKKERLRKHKEEAAARKQERENQKRALKEELAARKAELARVRSEADAYQKKTGEEAAAKAKGDKKNKKDKGKDEEEVRWKKEAVGHENVLDRLKAEARKVKVEEKERLDEELSAFDAQRALFGARGRTLDLHLNDFDIAEGDLIPVSYSVLLDSGHKISAPEEWLVLEWELKDQLPPSHLGIANGSEKSEDVVITQLLGIMKSREAAWRETLKGDAAWNENTSTTKKKKRAMTGAVRQKFAESNLGAAAEEPEGESEDGGDDEGSGSARLWS